MPSTLHAKAVPVKPYIKEREPMRNYDIAAVMKQIGGLWPMFANKATPEQLETIEGEIARIPIELAQATAILKAAYTESDKGWPPIPAIVKAMRHAGQQFQERQLDGDRPCPLVWHTEQLSDGFRRHGLAYPFVSEQHEFWCKRAKRLGLDVHAIAAEAMGITVAEVVAGLGDRYHNREASIKSIVDTGEARRMAKLSLGEKSKRPLPEAAL